MKWAHPLLWHSELHARCTSITPAIHGTNLSNYTRLVTVFPMCGLCSWCEIHVARCSHVAIVSGAAATRIARIHRWSVRILWMIIRQPSSCSSCIRDVSGELWNRIKYGSIYNLYYTFLELCAMRISRWIPMMLPRTYCSSMAYPLIRLWRSFWIRIQRRTLAASVPHIAIPDRRPSIGSRISSQTRWVLV